MAEPTVSLLPSAYDTNISLLGDVADHRTLSLKLRIDDLAVNIEVLGSFGFDLPCYMLFTDGTHEIIFVEQVTVEPSMIEGELISVTRGVRGTQAAAHEIETNLALTISGKHINMLRDALIAAQKYQGLVGLESALPVSPKAGEVYIATDTQNIFFSISSDGTVENGEWQMVSRSTHVDLDDLTGDSHPIYHNDVKAANWHNTLSGGHVVDGDTHDHLDGNGVGKVLGGAPASLPTPPAYAGHIYFDTNSELHISMDTTTWKTIIGVSAGLIAMFDDASLARYGGGCPPGWSRFTALDGKFPIGADALKTGQNDLVVWGFATHMHTYSDVGVHSHTVLNIPLTASDRSSHNHVVYEYDAGSGLGILDAVSGSPEPLTTTFAGSHSHNFTYGAHNTSSTKNTLGASGVDTGETDTVDTMPPYAEVVFCRKD